jgi:hypothetical protein
MAGRMDDPPRVYLIENVPDAAPSLKKILVRITMDGHFWRGTPIVA